MNEATSVPTENPQFPTHDMTFFCSGENLKEKRNKTLTKLDRKQTKNEIFCCKPKQIKTIHKVRVAESSSSARAWLEYARDTIAESNAARMIKTETPAFQSIQILSERQEDKDTLVRF